MPVDLAMGSAVRRGDRALAGRILLEQLSLLRRQDVLQHLRELPVRLLDARIERALDLVVDHLQARVPRAVDALLFLDLLALAFFLAMT